VPGLLCAVAAALAYGLATVLQSVGARRVAAGGPEPWLRRLARSAPYLAGLGLDGAGFGLAVVALHRLPVYAVQAIVSANLAVVALLAHWLLGVVLPRPDRLRLAAVAVGLALVAGSAAAGPAATLAAAGRWALLGAAAGLAAVSAAAARRPAASGPALGTLVGLEFGVVALAGRVVSWADPLRLPADPAAWALAGAGLVALLVYPVALGRGPLTATSAALVAAETVAPALAAAVLLGDLPRPGWWPAAVAGTVLVLAGAAGLARHEGAGGSIQSMAERSAGRQTRNV
jgi:hypothetical protein